ncbi:MAG: hypothetical protein IJF11_00650 [Clostridia bacterium]|nr:hypothetical protein [Clostridia bacterium]
MEIWDGYLSDGSSCATMTRKLACNIDKLAKTKAGISMESKADREHRSKLIFEIEF